MVATLGGERERRGRGAMWPDAFSRVGSMLHQETDEVRTPRQHGMMKRPMLVVLRDVQMDELGASVSIDRTASRLPSRTASTSRRTVTPSTKPSAWASCQSHTRAP